MPNTPGTESLFALLPSGRSGIAEMREFAAKMDPDIGPMFGDYVVRLTVEAERLRAAAEGLLDWAERFQGGDPSLDPEEWYINRDFARVVLGRA